MDYDLHIPWDDEALRELLQNVISRGEVTKVDFKAMLDLESKTQKAELAKDISALANSYDSSYRNYGFLVIGVSKKKLGYCTFKQDEDSLQATIDQIVRSHIAPFVPTQTRIFDDGEKKTWGVVVVPPTLATPHMTIRDSEVFQRGDVFVRRGTTTDKAEPADIARFFGQQIQEQTYNLRESIKDLQGRVKDLETQMDQAPFSAKPDISEPKGKKRSRKTEAPLSAKGVAQRIREELRAEEDEIVRGLFQEAKKIRAFMDSDQVPWVLGDNPDECKASLASIDQACKEFWLAALNLTLFDKDSKYEEPLVRSVQYLAKLATPPPSVGYNSPGESLRYYPLVVTLYIIFIVGVSNKRTSLLKKILDLELQGRSSYDEPMPIMNALFFIRRADVIFHPLYNEYPQRKWCDPIASVIKLLLEKLMTFDDPTIDFEQEFFIGEFVLSISPIDSPENGSRRLMGNHPSSGLFLYYSTCIPQIARFLKTNREWLQEVFRRPLRKILEDFDSTAGRLGSGRCFTDGFAAGAVKAAFPEERSTESQPN